LGLRDLAAWLPWGVDRRAVVRDGEAIRVDPPNPRS
jgi:hypothetical protein